MIEIFSIIFATYAITLLLGLGIYELCVPLRLRRRFLFLTLAPGLGLLELSMCGAYVTAFSRYVGDTLPIAAGLSIALSGFALYTRLRRNGLAGLAPASLRHIEPAECIRGTVFCGVLAAVLLPIFSAGIATTPYRVGIDQVGYGQTAQYLIEGGTLDNTRAALLKDLATHDLTKAKAQNMKALDFGLYVSSEFLLKALRWGYPATVATITIALHAGHVYRTEFIMLVLSCALLMMLVIDTLERRFDCHKNVALVGGATLLLNCNLLNVMYEGQLAQIFSLPYLFLFMLVYLAARSSNAPTIDGDDRRIVALSALLIGGILSSYNEALVLLVGMVIAAQILDLLFYGAIHRRSLVAVLAAWIAGGILMLPVAGQWISYSIANLRLLGHSGFWQPHWASVAEILGLLNMYDPAVNVLVERTPSNASISMWLSIVLALATAIFLFRPHARRIDRSFWSVPLLLTLVAYLKIRYLDMIINYSYMKIYTVFLPFIACIVFAAVVSLIPKARRLSIGFGLAMSTVIVCTGFRYVDQYRRDGHFITSAMFELYATPRRFSDVALITRGTDLADYMLTPLIATHWVDQNGLAKMLRPHANMPVYLLAEERYMSSRAQLLHGFPREHRLETNDFVVVDMQKSIKQLCPSAAAPYAIDELGLQSDDTWSTIPKPQCDVKTLFTTIPGLMPKAE